MMHKALSLIVLLLAALSGFIYFQNKYETLESQCKQRTPAKQLIELIHQDFENLNVRNKLPKEWMKIKKVGINMNSTLAAALLGKERPQFKMSQNGTHFLELEILDVPDTEDPGIILQISLIDLKSNNKIYEIGRTYNMSQLNKPH